MFIISEYEAERFATGILAPACVIWALNIHEPKDIANLYNISITSARIRAERKNGVIIQKGIGILNKLVSINIRSQYTNKAKADSMYVGKCQLEHPDLLSSERGKKRIDGDYNLQPYGGAETCYKGMSRLDVWNKTRTSVRMPKPEELNLMMMRSMRCQKIKRNGVYVEIFGEKLWYMDLRQTNVRTRNRTVLFMPAEKTVTAYGF